MKNLISRALTGLAAGALAIATVATMSLPAHAADLYTPHGGPGVAATGNDIAFTDVFAEQTFSCEQFDLHGALISTGLSRPFGTTATTWDHLDYSGCTNPIFGETTLVQTGIWGFAITGPEAGTVSPATLTSVAFLLSSAGCSFNITGEVSGTFEDTTGVFTPSGSTLTIADDPAGFICPLLGFMKGDDISVSGTWTITGLTVTNP
ncbi:hypothetical protein [Nocardioides albus]|uniref:Secreted protein n=1 Tax=Nocardioides albus TaxID=1841 RepID=A0A7W5A7R0_9ACTN|nr:hypothetical protein [Nocardioides albus]MBB3091020.1 hypothetical protein [Nocardioides albus]GGU39071.1 hypothetical protein GCM10007979_42910 [Nocardioides albus]